MDNILNVALVVDTLSSIKFAPTLKHYSQTLYYRYESLIGSFRHDVTVNRAAIAAHEAMENNESVNIDKDDRLIIEAASQQAKSEYLDLKLNIDKAQRLQQYAKSIYESINITHDEFTDPFVCDLVDNALTEIESTGYLSKLQYTYLKIEPKDLELFKDLWVNERCSTDITLSGRAAYIVSYRNALPNLTELLCNTKNLIEMPLTLESKMSTQKLIN